MVYVEGAAKFIRNYKHLMLDRIDWTQPARPRGGEDVEIDVEHDDDGKAAETSNASPPEETQATSLENNKCLLVWEDVVDEVSYGWT